LGGSRILPGGLNRRFCGFSESFWGHFLGRADFAGRLKSSILWNFGGNFWGRADFAGRLKSSILQIFCVNLGTFLVDCWREKPWMLWNFSDVFETFLKARGFFIFQVRTRGSRFEAIFAFQLRKCASIAPPARVFQEFLGHLDRPAKPAPTETNCEFKSDVVQICHDFPKFWHFFVSWHHLCGKSRALARIRPLFSTFPGQNY
jgi:hypothetical protein